MASQKVFDEFGRVSRQSEVLDRLREAVQNELGDSVDQLNLDEQRWGAGGGVHFSAVWVATETNVLIKLGATQKEVHWTRLICERAPDLVPTLFASGRQMGEIQIGWTVTERIKHSCMGPQYLGAEFPMLLEGAVRFQQATRGLEPDGIGTLDESLLAKWLAEGLRQSPPGPVGRVEKRMVSDLAWVKQVCQDEICHGDVQMCNGLTRHDPPANGPLLLIDCQPIVQPWAFDAGYLQVINSIDKSRKGFLGLIPQMASFREARLMSTPPQEAMDRLSAIVLGWFAIRQWGRNPDRHRIPDYRDMTELYIRNRG